MLVTTGGQDNVDPAEGRLSSPLCPASAYRVVVTTVSIGGVAHVPGANQSACSFLVTSPSISPGGPAVVPVLFLC